MRSAALGSLFLAILAAALTGTSVQPSQAAPSSLTISVEHGRCTRSPPAGSTLGCRSASPSPGRWPVAGSRSGIAATATSSATSCVTAGRPVRATTRSSGRRRERDSWVDEFDDAGRYEAFARTTDEISNFATFTPVLDECRWTVVRDQQSFGRSETGDAVCHCNHHRNGLLELAADDGTRLISTGYGYASKNWYYPNRLSNPDLGFGVADSYDRPAIGSMRLKLGPKARRLPRSRLNPGRRSSPPKVELLTSAFGGQSFQLALCARTRTLVAWAKICGGRTLPQADHVAASLSLRRDRSQCASAAVKTVLSSRSRAEIQFGFIFFSPSRGFRKCTQKHTQIAFLAVLPSTETRTPKIQEMASTARVFAW